MKSHGILQYTDTPTCKTREHKGYAPGDTAATTWSTSVHTEECRPARSKGAEQTAYMKYQKDQHVSTRYRSRHTP